MVEKINVTKIKIAENKISTDKYIARLKCLIFVTDTKIIEVASKPLSRLPDGYELEAADDESSDSTSSFSDDYELCG